VAYGHAARPRSRAHVGDQRIALGVDHAERARFFIRYVRERTGERQARPGKQQKSQVLQVGKAEV
jgi:hypothetical protein